MTLQRVVLRLTELRCLAQSEGSGGSEPYLWTTFFAFGGVQLPGQSGPLAVITPTYDAFRTEFPDGIKAGRAVPVPGFIASGSFDMDLDAAPRPKLVGAIAVLMEEDSTRKRSIILGRIAYAKEIENQLNTLAAERIRSGNFASLSDDEINGIKNAVEAKVKSAIGSNQSVWDVFRDQDDNLGFMYKTFTFPSADPASEIRRQYFDFRDSGPGTSDHFRLSGMLSLELVPTQPVVLCAAQRAALKAKQDVIASLQRRVQLLQAQLQTATPQQKPGLVYLINETKAAITEAETQVPVLQAALDACLPNRPGDVNTGTGGVSR